MNIVRNAKWCGCFVWRRISAPSTRRPGRPGVSSVSSSTSLPSSTKECRRDGDLFPWPHDEQEEGVIHRPCGENYTVWWSVRLNLNPGNSFNRSVLNTRLFYYQPSTSQYDCRQYQQISEIYTGQFKCFLYIIFCVL